MGLIQEDERTKKTFEDKIMTQTASSKTGFMVAIDNFETFSMEKYGKVNIIPDMKEFKTINGIFDVLQSWIN